MVTWFVLLFHLVASSYGLTLFIYTEWCCCWCCCCCCFYSSSPPPSLSLPLFLSFCLFILFYSYPPPNCNYWWRKKMLSYSLTHKEGPLMQMKLRFTGCLFFLFFYFFFFYSPPIFFYHVSLPLSLFLPCALYSCLVFLSLANIVSLPYLTLFSIVSSTCEPKAG